MVYWFTGFVCFGIWRLGGVAGKWWLGVGLWWILVAELGGLGYCFLICGGVLLLVGWCLR